MSCFQFRLRLRERRGVPDVGEGEELVGAGLAIGAVEEGTREELLPLPVQPRVAQEVRQLRRARARASPPHITRNLVEREGEESPRACHMRKG